MQLGLAERNLKRHRLLGSVKNKTLICTQMWTNPPLNPFNCAKGETPVTSQSAPPPLHHRPSTLPLCPGWRQPFVEQRESSICALWLVSYAYSASQTLLRKEVRQGWGCSKRGLEGVENGLVPFGSPANSLAYIQNAQTLWKNLKQCRKRRYRYRKRGGRKVWGKIFSLNFSHFLF